MSVTTDKTAQLGLFDALDSAKTVSPYLSDVGDWLEFVSWRTLNKGLTLEELELLAEGFQAAWSRRGSYPQREGGNP